MKRFMSILGIALLPVLMAAQKPKYPYNHVFHASVNTITVYAEAYTGSSTAQMVNNAISDNVPPARIVIDSHMAGTSCDFTGITLLSSQYSLVDLREGKIAWGFKDPNTTNIVCEVQSGTGGTTINTLTVNNFNNSGSGANGLISGGSIYYTGTGFDYTVTRALYTIGGVTYSSPQSNITLAASDPTNPRIDVVYVDNTASVGVLTGTPAAAPSQPSIDPTTQIELGFITVPAASTSPSGTVTENIYLEDAGPPAEWGCATSGAGWNCADTTHPFQGTKDIQSLGTDASSYVHLTRSAAEDISGDNLLFFQMRSETAWHGKFEIWATFYNGSTPVGSTVFAQANAFGWDGKTTGAYQLVGIPLSAFGLSSNSVDGLRILWNNGGTSATNATIYLDQIQLQQNGVGGGGSGGGGGTISSVGLQGDSVTSAAAVGNSPLTSGGTMQLAPASAPAGYIPMGPIGASGSNVAVRQVIECSSMPCSVPGVASGDFIAIATGTNSNALTVTDSLSTTFSLQALGGGNYYTGAASAAGNDQITVTGSYQAVVVLDMSGTAALVGSSFGGSVLGNGSAVVNRTLSPSSATDGLVPIFAMTQGTNSPDNFSLNPSSPTIGSGLDTPAGFGYKAWLNGPGSTASFTASFHLSISGCGLGCNYNSYLLDFTQSATAGSAPLVQRRLVPSDLPASSRSPIESVQSFTISSAVNLPSATNTTVLSGSVTMPSDGCPCRVNLQSGIFLNSTTSAQWGFWASDGANTFGYGTSITTDAHTPPVQIASISPVSYSNGQTVTFSIIINPGTYSSGTVQALATLSPPLPAAAHSWMTVTVLPSVN